MLPADRGPVGQQRIGNVFELAQKIDGAFDYRVFQRMIAEPTRLRPEVR